MEPALKILILEDNPNDVFLLEYELKRSGLNFCSQVVKNRKAFEEALLNFKPDIILSDYSLPTFNGVKAFAIKQKLFPDTPFIIVSGTIGDENAAELIKSGVTDYALKSKLFRVPLKIARALKDVEKAREISMAELKIKISENKYRSLVEHASDAIMVIEDNGSIVDVNKSCISLFGYSRKELLAMDVHDLWMPEDVPRNQAGVFKLKVGQKIIFERKLRKSDNSEVEVEVSARRIQGGQIIGIIRDINERKAIELERELMLANIIQHSKNLEQFAYIVSHNLRSPVAHILGISNVLKNDISKEDRARSQNYLFAATEQLDSIIKDLNNILQVRSELNEYKEIVQFEELVDIVKSGMHHTTEKETVQIATDFSAIKEMNTIKSYLHSIFLNLISNSVKYRQAGKTPRIEIKTEVYDKRVRIIFKDDGLGIDLDKHGDKIFGLYKRFSLNTEGKGLGLFMVKTHIETLGGNIKVESKEGEGAKFTIELPVLAA